MPFVSEAQRRKCYVMQRQGNDVQLGLQMYGDKDKVASPRVKRRPKKAGKANGEQVYQGLRGGKYVIRKNKKVYL